MFSRRRQVPAQPPAVPRVSPVTADEIAWRDQQIEIAGIIAERYTGDTEPLPSLERLDVCVAGWSADDDSRVDANTLVNAVGIALGAHIAANGVLDWVIATDDDGGEPDLRPLVARCHRVRRAGAPRGRLSRAFATSLVPLDRRDPLARVAGSGPTAPCVGVNPLPACGRA